MPTAPPNRTGKKSAPDRPKVLFEAGFERLSTMAQRGPLSLPTLYRLAACGRLETTLIGGARCVTREAWKALIAGAPVAGPDVVEGAAQ